jgi:hypothetical protein
VHSIDGVAINLNRREIQDCRQAVASAAGMPAHVTVIIAGLAEVPGAVTDAVALAGAGGGAVHGPWAKAAVLPKMKQVNATRTPRDRTSWPGARNCIAVLQRASAGVRAERGGPHEEPA